MAFELLDVVVLTRDLPEYGLRLGETGTVVDVHSLDALCVEFVDEFGRTLAVATIQAADIRKA